MKVLVEWCSRDNGSWVAETRQVPGTRICSDSKHRAVTQTQLMVMRALAEQFEAEGSAPVNVSVSLSPTPSPELGTDKDTDIAYLGRTSGTRELFAHNISSPYIVCVATSSRS